MFRIELLNDKECAIIGYEGEEKEIAIPCSIDGKTVRMIDEYAFSATKIQKVTIPDTVKTIGNKAFHECCNLEEIIFNKGLLAIEYSSFCANHCKKIVIPEGVTIIQTYAFCDCPLLEEVYIPSSVQTIEKDAFSMNENLVDVTIPERFKNQLNEIFKEDNDYKYRRRKQSINYKFI